VGIGPGDDGVNPFLRAELPVLRGLLDGQVPTLDAPEIRTASAMAWPLDALLGVEGTPQSGTGQTTLLTGRNAARLFGRHFGPWTPTSLRPVLAGESILARTLAAGRSAAFANAYPRGFLESAYGRRPAAPPLAAHGAGLLVRHEEALGRGQALASEIVNTGWRTRLGFTDLPDIGPAEAGSNLARIAGDHHLTLYAHYTTDHAGHRGGMAGAVRALERVDAFLGGLLQAASPELGILVTSDHGNIEDVRGGHTLNPALALGTGWIAERAAADMEADGLRSLQDVAGLLLEGIETP
jgi:hypothetical protein